MVGPRNNKLVVEPKRRRLADEGHDERVTPWTMAAKSGATRAQTGHRRTEQLPRYKKEVVYVRLRRHEDHDQDTEGSSAYSEDSSGSTGSSWHTAERWGGESEDRGGRRATSTTKYKEAERRTRDDVGGGAGTPAAH